MTQEEGSCGPFLREPEVSMSDEARIMVDGQRRPGVRRPPLLRVQMVQLVCEGVSPFARRNLGSAADVYDAFRDLCGSADREHFWSIALDNKHRIVGVEEAARGSLTCTVVHPREVYKALIVINAAAAIFVHNHPSGDPTPSREDIDITRRLRDVGELIGIRILDHLVIGHDRYVSMVDDGYW